MKNTTYTATTELL